MKLYKIVLAENEYATLCYALTIAKRLREAEGAAAAGAHSKDLAKSHSRNIEDVRRVVDTCEEMEG